ncbi:MAG: hypothetical protein J6S67_22190 [Methanobrevibacter sp.]|nr:hypothetical protein [Methanobrevibacter sp.]
MTSLEFIAQELGVAVQQLITPCRKPENVRKRWVAILVYRLFGFSYTRIAGRLSLNHSTVQHGIECAGEAERAKAKEIYIKLKNEQPDWSLLPHRTKIVKIPDYKHGKIIYKEVEI